MSEHYTGFRQFEVEPGLVDKLYDKGKIDVWDKRLAFYPNMYVELRDQACDKHTALGKVNRTGEFIKRIQSTKVSGIEPRNREQVFALDALMNDKIPVVVLTGATGSGKTLLALSAALEKIQQRKYRKVILTRPMSEVGRYKLGALPGDASEKFGPYLLNYLTNLEQFVGGRLAVQDLLEQSKFEMIPPQLMRGASFNNCLVLADEMQVFNNMEVLTIGTRTGEGSKLIVMGDLNQRDFAIAKKDTGLYFLIQNEMFKKSPLTAIIELQQCERSAVSRLFADVFVK